MAKPVLTVSKAPISVSVTQEQRGKNGERDCPRKKRKQSRKERGMHMEEWKRGRQGGEVLMVIT